MATSVEIQVRFESNCEIEHFCLQNWPKVVYNFWEVRLIGSTCFKYNEVLKMRHQIASLLWLHLTIKKD